MNEVLEQPENTVEEPSGPSGEEMSTQPELDEEDREEGGEESGEMDLD